MTVQEAISHANALTGQAADQATQLRWLSELDGQFAFDLYCAETWKPYTEDDLGGMLLIPYPWDGLYVHHLEAMAYYSRGEYERYNNSLGMRERTLAEFKAFVQRTRAKCGKITIAQAGDGGSGIVTVSGPDVWRYISAYGVALLHGYEGTPEEWLDSLIGPTGPRGPGIASIDKTGTSGNVDTYTITLESGGTYTFTVTNTTGISSVVKTATVGIVDTYTITFSDGTTTTFNVTNGAKGDQGAVGPQGPQGIQGPQGPQGIQGVKGDTGETAYQAAVSAGYTGTEAQFNRLMSAIDSYVASAQSSAQNAAGSAAQTAAWAGRAPYIGSDNHWYVYSSEAGDFIDTGISAQGPIGPQGVQGPQGTQGPQGVQGPAGPRGIDGVAVAAEGQYAFNVTEAGHLTVSYTGDDAPDFSINENGHLILTI